MSALSRMRAVVVERPGGPEVLDVRDVAVPRAKPGQEGTLTNLSNGVVVYPSRHEPLAGAPVGWCRQSSPTRHIVDRGVAIVVVGASFAKRSPP